jgi:hypothetical protein
MAVGLVDPPCGEQRLHTVTKSRDAQQLAAIGTHQGITGAVGQVEVILAEDITSATSR